jgi:putative DNA primase/helicase
VGRLANRGHPLTVHTHALAYLSRGWQVVPIPPRRKGPVIDGWIKLRLAPEDVPRRFGPNDNVGVILGDPSSSLVDVDLDCQEALALAPEFLPATFTFGRASKPASHWLFTLKPPGGIRRYQDPVTGETLLELRGSGGQTVFPGSTHESGEVITWDAGAPPPDGTPAPECPDLAARTARLAARVLAERYGADMPPEVEAKIRAWRGEPPPPPPVRPLRRPADLLERARRYADACPGAVSGQGGHRATFRVALALVKGFDIPQEDAARILADYNTRCSPPWSDRELAHKIDSAAKATLAPGWLLVPRKSDAHAHPFDQDDGEEPSAKRVYRCTDMGNAERFAAHHLPIARYVGTWGKWIAWDGRRWALDSTCQVEWLAKKTVRGIAADAARCDDDDVRGAMLKWAHKSEAAGRVSAIVGLARSEPGIGIEHSALDQQPWLLTVANGTVDLRTGKLGPHDRAHLITRAAPVAFDPTARAPRWLQFLEEVQPDPEVRAYLQRLAGYCATGLVRDHVLPIFWGVGRNGKGVYIRALAAVLGELAVTIAPEVVMEADQARHPTELTTLFGARLAVTSETEEGRGLSVARVKRLTGGDTIRARRMREDDWEFPPTHKLTILTNYKPAVRDNGDAIWDRVHLVPWLARFPNGSPSQDPTLDEKLASELPGILAWVVAGCLEWQAKGLAAPQAVRLATAAYRGASDPLSGWIADCCVEAEGAQARFSALYASYQSWCGANGDTPLKGRTFGDRLTERGYPADKGTGGGAVRRGIGLRNG